MHKLTFSCLLAAALVACGDDDDGPITDAGIVADGATSDGGRADGGSPSDAGRDTDAEPDEDAGTDDAGSMDADVVDADSMDASANDGAALDGGSMDDGGGRRDGSMMSFRGLTLRLMSFDPHISQKMELWLVDDTNQLATRAILTALPAAMYSLQLPGSRASGVDYEARFYADLDGTADYSGGDHSWTIDVAASQMGPIMFPHSTEAASGYGPLTAPTPLDHDAVIELVDFSPHVAHAVEVRVVDGSGRLVGLWANPELGDEDVTVRIPGVIDAGGGAYTVSIWADANDNGTYQAPPIDHAWRIEATVAADDDLEVEQIHSTDWVDVAF